jgi:hypothetical protein
MQSHNKKQSHQIHFAKRRYQSKNRRPIGRHQKESQNQTGATTNSNSNSSKKTHIQRTMEPEQPKKEEKKPKEEAPKTEEEHKSIHFLKVDHTLRPEGMHFDAEMGANRR